MTPPQAADVRVLLEDALLTLVTGDLGTANELFTEDVAVLAPHLDVMSRAELQERLADCAGALSNITTIIDEIHVDGPTATVAWAVTADHAEPLLVHEDELFEPTGRRLHTSGRALVVFQHGRIRAVRCRENPPTLRAQLLAAR